jgi:hypothetical protein
MNAVVSCGISSGWGKISFAASSVFTVPNPLPPHALSPDAAGSSS